MKLATREFPLVRFRGDLPAWLQPVGKAYIEVDARPMGKVNLAFMAGRSAWANAKAIEDRAEGRKPEKQADGTELSVPLTADQTRAWLGMVYDTCVIAWRTNLIDEDTGAPVPPTREGFMALADVQLAELADVFTRFQIEAMQAAAKVIEEDEATIKN